MKLLVLSDLHLDVAPLELSRNVDFDVAVLAGDIRAPGDAAIRWMRASNALRGRPVVFVPGNHEYYGAHLDQMRDRMRELAQHSNVHVLDGDVVVLDGVRFLGATLWTDFGLAMPSHEGLQSDPPRAMRAAALGLADYLQIRFGECRAASGPVPGGRVLRPQDTAEIHAGQRAWLLNQLRSPSDGTTVVVTHHAPHRRSLAPRFQGNWLSPAFVSELPDEFFQVPALWVHGHTHECFDYVVHETRVVCNPRGYVRTTRHECPGFAPHRVIEV